ncbi:hypothetical protein ACJQWK_05793 [Exserohilum turcicum]
MGKSSKDVLAASLVIYNSTDQEQNDAVKLLGMPSEEMHTHVHYAYGNEGSWSWHGYENCIQETLKGLE